MENLTECRSLGDDGFIPDLENKRKRRCSTQFDRSPIKKILVTEAAEDISVNSKRENCVESEYNELQSCYLDKLCDEILYEILKFLDTWSLMTLMNVSERLQKFVLDKRLWENINLCEEPLPLGILEDMLERSHEKTASIKLRGPCPTQHLTVEIKQFNETMVNSFATRCTKLVTLELYGVTLDFNQIGLKDFPPTLKRLVLNTCNVRLSSNKSLFSDIHSTLINLQELAIENNLWFDPYYVMPLSKMPLLRYLSLRGCWQMQEFIPYGSIAARQGFKQLEILDLRDTPLNDSDLQCFNAVETLKEIYLQCPIDTNEQDSASKKPQSDEVNSESSHVITDAKKLKDVESCTSNKFPLDNEFPSTSANAGNTEEQHKKIDEPIVSSTPISLYLNECKSTSASSSSSTSSANPQLGNVEDSNSGGQKRAIILPRSCLSPRPDHIVFLDVRNRNSPNAVHFNVHDQQLMQFGEAVLQNHPRPTPPVIDQMVRHNLFWDIVNPLGRLANINGPNRIYGEDNSDGCHFNLFSAGRRQLRRGTISDRGVCCFGRTRQPVQQGVIWIRFNNRPSENRFERFSVRDYKFVTDVSLHHLVQCSPHLIFLDVSGTSVTLEGLQRFKDLKPECNVVAEHLLGATKNEKKSYPK